MKYEKHIIDTLLQALRDKKGRIQACKEAGISFEIFCVWMGKRKSREQEKKVEFIEAVKNAEEERDESMTAYAELAIFRAMKDDWRAAAWWLERTNQRKYALIHKIEQKNITDNDNKPAKEKTIDELQSDITKLEKEIATAEKKSATATKSPRKRK